MQVLTFSFVMDFAGYWWHRWAHASSILWAMHRVHHSDEELNPLTNFRVHFGDMLIRGLIQVIPSIILSPSAAYFFIAVLLETFSTRWRTPTWDGRTAARVIFWSARNSIESTTETSLARQTAISA